MIRTPRERALPPLVAPESTYGRPTRRVCLLMADIEEADGHLGAVREVEVRAARAPHDKAWVADGIISDRWAPASPSGQLDAFAWRTPDERIAAPFVPTSVQPQPVVEPPSIPPPRVVIAEPAPPPPEPTPRADQPPEVSLPARRPSVALRPLNGAILDPARMAPDDPGPRDAEQIPRDARLYASE